MSKQQVFWGFMLILVIAIILNMTFRIDRIIKPIILNIKNQYLYIKKVYGSISYNEIRRDVKGALRELRKIKDYGIENYY